MTQFRISAYSIALVALVAMTPTLSHAQTVPPATTVLGNRPKPKYPTNLPPAETRRAGGASVLTGELSRIGEAQTARSATPETVRERFGVATFTNGGDKTLRLPVLVRRVAGSSDDALSAGGADVLAQIGALSVAFVKPADLQRVAALPGVASVTPFRTSGLPTTPPRVTASQVPVTRGEVTTSPATVAAFYNGGLTGKGVAVAIADSGMDYRHEDFQNADGTTRILAIWDVFDTTYQKSGGKIGSKQPYTLKDGTPVGTVYTREQINNALKTKSSLPTRDLVGHGTACAGNAAGNGRGAGANAKSFAGVAPDATL